MKENISQIALQAHLREIEARIGNAPPEVLAEAKRHREIEMHNLQIDQARAKKQQFKAIAKQSRLPVDQVKRIITGATATNEWSKT